jgi:alkyl sulfatase BDS1-like metallo-beta-lactamase superfamily hydrolase
VLKNKSTKVLLVLAILHSLIEVTQRVYKVRMGDFSTVSFTTASTYTTRKMVRI